MAWILSVFPTAANMSLDSREPLNNPDGLLRGMKPFNARRQAAGIAALCQSLATPQGTASGPALWGFPAEPGSALRLLDRLTACLRKRALSPTLQESQKAIRVIQRLPSILCESIMSIVCPRNFTESCSA